MSVVEHLTFLQLDPTAAIAPSADLVAWTRLGNVYDPAQLTAALEQDRTLYEVRAIIRPTADLGLHLSQMAAWPFVDEGKRQWSAPGPRAGRWLEANDAFRRDVLELLRKSGPLLSRDIADTSVVPWESTGWTGNRNVTQMLEFLSARGEVATSRRVGRQRLWDLAERGWPATETLPLREAERTFAEQRFRALGVRLEQGEWVAHPEVSDTPVPDRVTLLSPFDRLVHDRVRAQELFDFDYYLEMYKPEAKRRWGYFALPVLHDDQLVGKVDAIADRKASVLRVNAIHEDVRFTRAVTKAVHAELDALAAWLGLSRLT